VDSVADYLDATRWLSLAQLAALSALGWTPVAKAGERAPISALGAGGAAYR
jgi:hypothetical protein